MEKKLLIQIICFFYFLNLVFCQTSEEIVKIDSGYVYGSVDIFQGKARAFLGIPFAAPPVGDLRWKEPQPPKSWSGNLWARNYQAGCPQVCNLPPYTCPTNFSEDCLTLNVFTPRQEYLKTPKSVLVFFPGGNFQQSGADIILYDGWYICNTSQTILVTTNYRLGALGWVYDGDQLTGNIGFLDQQFALRWVQRNIAAFGGDPNLVTIFGQSAGAASVAGHLISPGSTGLFRAAIVESNPWVLIYTKLNVAIDYSNRFANYLGCPPKDINCMRSKSADEVVEAQNKASLWINPEEPLSVFMPLTPVVDGKVIPTQPFTAFMDGNITNKVPIIFGTVSNESLLFVYEAFPNGLSEQSYTAILSLVFGIPQARKIEARYPYNMFPDGRDTLSYVGTQWMFECPGRAVSRGLQATVPVYQYWFNHIASFGVEAWGPNFTFCYSVVCHGSELAYIYHTVYDANYTFDSQESYLASEITKYWTNFAISLQPNYPAKVAVNWPSFTTSNDVTMMFETPQQYYTSGLFSDECDFWDSIGYLY
eukprot:TRINITY_DN1724_c0_g1_i3.p1 TRINITY_DN1724_c0_g1~~TRINITY_DN1724_c0_g1_i3.p1  ORF type:complete len:535 (+),score=239.08 TRINITY_DN1724_c0_g1_i3:64-1668(+)